MSRNCLFESAGYPMKKSGKPIMEAKTILIDHVRETTGVEMSPDVLTFGFARRATAYKRADLLFSDLERLKAIGAGKIQIIYAGKAHPNDHPGKALIESIFAFKETIKDAIKMVYLPNYDMELALKWFPGWMSGLIPLLDPGRLRAPAG